MRRSLGAIHRSPIGNATTTLSLIPSTVFSTAAGGRGCGRGSPLFSDPTLPGIPAEEDDVPASKPGLGHGRGKRPTPIPTLQTESPFAGTRRGRAPAEGIGTENRHKLPIFFTKTDPSPSPVVPEQARGQIGDMAARSDLHLGIVSALSGAGRGKTDKERIPSDRPIGEVKIENRHLKAKQAVKSDEDRGKFLTGSQKLSRDDAVRKAMGILSKGDSERGRGRATDR